MSRCDMGAPCGLAPRRPALTGSVIVGSLLLALLWGCTSKGFTERSRPVSPPASLTKAQRIAAFIEGGWGFEIGRDRDAVTATLGTPDRLEVETVPNRHVPGVVDSIFTMIYDGLHVELHHATPVNKDLLAGLLITDPRYDVLWGLRVGISTARVREVLGEPHAYRQSTYVYSADDPAANRVLFHFTDGTLRELEWQFYVD